MSYDVKYRLDFTDVIGYPYRVEILKKDYDGPIYPLVGGKDPVKITWQSSNDFYKPIIGSKCTLSLLDTETTNYDEFYKFDEREYKVNIYYGIPESEVFHDRVFADDVNIESLGCVDDKMEYITTANEYVNRVLDDDGIIESPLCFQDRITNSFVVDYDLYWTGFLVVDRYKEKLQAKPYNITFNAFDGLGTLDDYDAPVFERFNPTGPNNAFNDIQRITTILQNLDLEIDAVFQNDLGGTPIFGYNYPIVTPPRRFPYLTTIYGPNAELTDRHDYYNCKEMLERILSFAGMRIFQSFGKWHIVQTTNMFDKGVKDFIVSYLNGTGDVASNIRDRIFVAIANQDDERFFTETFGTDALPISEKNDFVQVSAPERLIPLNRTLQTEYLQPIAEVITDYKRNDNAWPFFNPGMEYNYTAGSNIYPTEYQGWNLAGVRLTTDDYMYKGKLSAKVAPGVNPQVDDYTMFQIPKLSGSILDRNIDLVADCGFNLHVFNKLSTSSSYIGTSVEIRFRPFLAISWNGPTYFSTDFYRWNQQEKEWIQQTSAYITHVESNQANQYENIKVKFNTKGIIRRDTEEDANGYFNNVGSISFNVTMITPRTTEPNWETTYYDNITPILPDRNVEPDLDRKYKIKLTNGGTRTTKKTFKIDNYVFNFGRFRSREFNTGFGTGLDPFILNSRNVANDYREFVKRYDGLFRSKNRKPLSFHNKVWFNFGSNLRDKQSTIIDGMTFNLKANEYKIKSHVPNDDNDVDVTINVQ